MPSATYPADVPNFDGQSIFGDLASFSVVEIPPGNAGEAAAIDVFLGRAVGTSVYGAEGGGKVFGIKGALIGSSFGAVAAMRSTLLSFTGISSRLGVPTGDKFPSDFAYFMSCYFVVGDFVPSPSGIVAIGGGMWSLSYVMVFRQIAGGIGP